MDSQIYSKGSYNPTSGSHSSRPLLLPQLQQHPTHTTAPPLVQQGHPTPYLYPLPPPPTSSAPQAPLIPMPVTTQSYAQSSYLYQTAQPDSQQGFQSVDRSSDQLLSPSLGQTYLPPSRLLPPPPPLPPATTSQGQALYRPSFSIPGGPGPPLSVPLRKLEPPGPGVLLPPPPPPSSSSLVPYLAAKKDEAEKHGEAIAFTGQVLDHEGTDCSKMDPAVGDGGSAKGSSIRYESSPPCKRVEPGSPLCANSDTEMEDDITQPEDDLGMNYSSQALYPGSNTNASALFNKEQLTLQHVSAETNSTMGPSRNLQTGLPVYNTSNSCVQLCQETDDDGSRQASSSPYSGRAKNVAESGSGDMYDPFLDSIEPSPNLSKMSTRVQEHEPASGSDIIPKLSISSNRPPDMEDNNERNYIQVPSSSDMMPRLSLSSNKPPDVEENTRGNDTGAVIPVTSGDHEEYGESANGVAGGVSLETDSPGSPDEVADSITKVGEDENAGKQSWEKMKDKEPRSMRLFKVVLTQFVKDLLKPSWRQGNMSKEAFKTIVKKTVDKVSSSMEGRRIPKSRAKIDRYIDSSQHKLTKLVMGYVDKYVKA